MVYLVLFYGSWWSNGGAASLVSCGIAFDGEMPSADRFSYHGGLTAGAYLISPRAFLFPFTTVPQTRHGIDSFHPPVSFRSIFSIRSSSFLYYDTFILMIVCSDGCIR